MTNDSAPSSIQAVPLLTLLTALQKAGGVADDRLGALETKAQTIELLPGFTARAGNRRLRLLSALRAHTKAP